MFVETRRPISTLDRYFKKKTMPPHKKNRVFTLREIKEKLQKKFSLFFFEKNNLSKWRGDGVKKIVIKLLKVRGPGFLKPKLHPFVPSSSRIFDPFCQSCNL